MGPSNRSIRSRNNGWIDSTGGDRRLSGGAALLRSAASRYVIRLHNDAVSFRSSIANILQFLKRRQYMRRERGGYSQFKIQEFAIHPCVRHFMLRNGILTTNSPPWPCRVSLPPTPPPTTVVAPFVFLPVKTYSSSESFGRTAQISFAIFRAQGNT